MPAEISSQAVIALYADHATHEQFHAEIKTDLDLEHLPSGKFATNDLILTLAAMAYNLVRLVRPPCWGPMLRRAIRPSAVASRR